MVAVVTRRLAAAIGTLFLISVTTFLLANLRSAQDIARGVLGREVAPEQLQAFVKLHGLDRPVWARYWSWLTGALHGNLGVSIASGRSVAGEIGRPLVLTLILACVAFAIAVPLSVLLGQFLARHWASPVDLTVSSALAVIAAIPEFVLGIVLVLVFSVTLHWLPIDSAGLSFGGPIDEIKVFVLPVATLVLSSVAYLARVTRATVRETLAAPHTRTAVLRGLPRNVVVWDHVLRSAASPIVSASGLTFLYLIGGVIVVENVFSFLGLGTLLVNSIQQGDVIVVEAAAMLLGVVVVVTGLITDMLGVYFNPRLREGAR